MHLQTEEQLQAVNSMTVSLRRKKTKHFLRQYVSFSQSEKNWLKHPIVDRSCWGTRRLHKSNQTVPFSQKCCPYYQPCYLQTLSRHMLLSGIQFHSEKQQVRLWIMRWSCHFKMVHFACVVYSGFAIVLICHPVLMIVFHWCGGSSVTTAWLKRVSLNKSSVSHSAQELSEFMISGGVIDFHRLSQDKMLMCGNVKLFHSIPLMFRDNHKQAIWFTISFRCA